MKQSFTILAFLALNVFLLISDTQAQNDLVLDWAENLGGGDNDYSNDIVVDDMRNVYVTGMFEGSSDFDPGPSVANLSSGANKDIFIAKYDSSGNYIYARSMGGSLSEDNGRSIAVDVSGNVYITGYFQRTADFDPSSNTVNLTSVATSRDIFIAKYDTVGNYVYAKSMGGSGSDSGNSIAVDGSGNVYVTGVFVGTVDFDPSANTANLTAAGFQGYADIFLAKYDADGNYLFANRMGGTSLDIGQFITLDTAANVYMTGIFRNIADFDPSADTANLFANTGNTTSVGTSGDIFIAKYDSAGNYIYAKGMGGPFQDAGNSIAVDNTGNVYVTGWFEHTVDFDPSGNTANLYSFSSPNIFIAKYDALGNYVYAKGMGATGIDNGKSIAVDDLGNVYVTGSFEGIVDFDPGLDTADLSSSGSYDIFIAKYNAVGNYVYAKKIGGSNEDFSQSIAVDGSGNVYLTGWFSGTVDFDPAQSTANLVSNSVDLFIARYTEQGIVTGINNIQENTSFIAYIANGLLHVGCSNCKAEATIELYDMSGRLVLLEKTIVLNGITIPFDNVSGGIYNLRVTSGKLRYSVKLIKPS